MIGYHATKKKNKESILNKGYFISKSNSYHHWLGDGIYFWEDSYYAVEWNIIDLEKIKPVTLKNMLANYIIFEANIKDVRNKTIDLSSPKGTIIFNNFKADIIECANNKQKEELKKIKDDVFWVNYMKEKGKFDKYDIVIATYDKTIKKSEKDKKGFIKYKQTQICVKNNDLIIKNIVYDDKEEIKLLYNAVKSNRCDKEKEVLI